MAIPMPIVQDIRRLDRQGMSRAQIARRLHVDRGTVAKYADMEDCSPKPKADRRYGSNVFCQVGVGRFGVSFSPCERRVSGRFGVGRSCWLLVIALVIA